MTRLKNQPKTNTVRLAASVQARKESRRETSSSSSSSEDSESENEEVVEKKAVVSGGLAKRLRAQRALAKHLNRQRFGRGNTDSIPIRSATMRHLVLSAAYYANDDQYASVSKDASNSIYSGAIHLAVQALVTARDAWLAQKTTKKSDDADMQAQVIKSTVRPHALELALKQKWTETDPVGFDSCKMFDDLMTRIQTNSEEVARVEKLRATKSATDERIKNRKLVKELEAKDSLKKKEKAQLRKLVKEDLAYKVDVWQREMAKLRKSGETAETASTDLRERILPNVQEEIALLNQRKISEAEQSLGEHKTLTAKLAEGVKKQRIKADSEDDPRQAKKHKADLKDLIKERNKEDKQEKKLDERAKYLHRHLKELKASVVDKEEHADQLDARKERNEKRVLELAKLVKDARKSIASSDMDESE
jgi:DNA repair exonuclease SbcCD ATPase subunit